MSNLVVCPKAGECRDCCYGGDTGHTEPHEEWEMCDCVADGCPACVPVKPEVIVGYPEPNPFTPMQDRR